MIKVRKNCVGLVHGVIGGFAAIVPSEFIVETLENPKVYQEETLLVKMDRFGLRKSTRMILLNKLLIIMIEMVNPK